MVPFKPYFLGEEVPPCPRATTVQKCVRAGGKHNDLDEIGRTTRHLTFFEMLGNFSFGDYFKDEAIPLRGSSSPRCSASTPTGSGSPCTSATTRPRRSGATSSASRAERIQRLDEDNFWAVGDTGPCGPCSRDLLRPGPELRRRRRPGPRRRRALRRDLEPRVHAVRPRSPTARCAAAEPNIDTGAGLERILSVLQGVDSVCDTDELRAAASTAAAAGHRHAVRRRRRARRRRRCASSPTTPAPMTFLVNDGVFPSNEDRGYVLRRIIRRAVRHAYLLGVEDAGRRRPWSTPSSRSWAAPTPSSSTNARLHPRRRRPRGGALPPDARDRARPSSTSARRARRRTELPGDVAFQLHDTYGFPLELTQEIAAERGVDGRPRRLRRGHGRAAPPGARGPQVGDGGDDRCERYRELLDAVRPHRVRPAAGRRLRAAGARAC